VTPVLFVGNPACERHDTGPGHPETAARLRWIREAVQADPALVEHGLVEAVAAPASLEDVLRVHSPAHLALLRAMAERAACGGRPDWIDPDTAVSGASWDAALAAAGTAIHAADAVVRREAATAFAAARPPGHHATGDRAMGFCLLSNVAIAARRLQQVHGVARVLVVDWDVHHGNGTQTVFWEDPSVFVLSVHEADAYPGGGAAWERGAGAGEGFTRNVPLPPGTDGAAWRRAFADALAATFEAFTPDVVLVSAGFDLLAGDPLGALQVSPEDLHAIAGDLVDAARALGAPLAAVLEGGYGPALGAGVVNVLRAFAGLPALAPLGAGLSARNGAPA
jgi:acetoin utilization deacetylase AcuC-like enzyme